MLNEKQLEAVNTTEGPVVIIAGPGTGKTKTLVERAVNILVNKKVNANKIMITTFTNKAARELEIRINEKLKELNQNIDISDMYLGTMHSIWARLIEENISYSNFFDNFQLMSGEYEQHFFIYSRLKEYKKIQDYQSFFDNLSYNGDWKKSEFLKNKFNDLNENAIDIENIETSDRYITFLKEAYKLYEKQLFEENILNFSYLQTEFLNMLVKNPDLLKKINEKFDYIMVDEYQDSNKIQEKILFKISEEKRNICVVGDEDQSIYRFRGASAENILNFSKNFTEDKCAVIILDKNYRSFQSIVDFNNSWIKAINWHGNRYDKNIVSAREDNILNSTNKNIFRVSGTTENDNARQTAIFIKKLKQEGKITNYNQVAVLFSNFKGNEAKKLEEALKSQDIEVYSPRTKIFFEMQEVKISFGMILGYFKKYFLEDELDKYLKDCINLARQTIIKDKKFCIWINERIENTSVMSYESLNDIFYEFFEFDYYKNILKEETANDSRAAYNLATLTRIFKNYQKYSKYEKLKPENNFYSVKYFFEKYMEILMNDKINKDDIFINEEDYPNDCVPFLTIHQSKGLEFPVVIVKSLYSKPKNLDEISNRQTSIDRLISGTSKISEQNKEYFDFYRKFYVAFTRAKNLLILSQYEKGVSENFKPFFGALPAVNGIHFDINEINIDDVADKNDKKILSYTTDILPYRNCPQRYCLLREKNFSTFERKKLNRGVLVHSAIEHINKLFLERNKDFNLDDDYIKNLIKNIYKFNKLNLDDNFEKIFNLLKKYIENERENFKFIKKVEASEYSIENDFILYGKIDLLLERDEELVIVDFKTGIYNEDNKYFNDYRQQLSLYKLLLEKKTEKKIKTYLYYLEEDEAKKEIIIEDEDLEKDIININKTVQDIMDKKFEKISYDRNICDECEFKAYCWGGEEV